MDEPWACSACTFINETGGTKCAICESPRPQPAPMQVDEEKPSTTVVKMETEPSKVDEPQKDEQKEESNKMEIDKPQVITWTEETLKAAEEKRKEASKRGKQERDPKGNYKLVCPACTKPNSLAVTHCSGCSFELSEWDEERMSDNVFLDLINGKDIGAKIHYRDNDVIVFDDKFGVSEDHLDIIPTRHVPDLTCLKKEDIPMLNLLYQRGLEELTRRKRPRFEGKNLEDFVVTGYNHPGSVAQLHLHMVLPPFAHEKVFQYPRWHSHSKVLRDLETLGEVKDYEKYPVKEEGEAEYQKAMERHNAILKAVQSQQPAEPEQPKEEKGKEKEKFYTASALERAFDSWSADNTADEQLLWLGEEKGQVTLGYGEAEFTLVFPRKGGATAFSVACKKFTPWVADVNDYIAHEKEIELHQLFTKIQDIIAGSKKKGKRKIEESMESAGSVEEDSDDDMGLIGTGVEEENDKNWFEEKIMNPHLEKVASEVRAALDLLGPSKISTRGNCQVIVTTTISDIISETVCAAIEVTMDEPVLVTFDFSRFWGLDKSTKRLPLPTFSCRQWTTSDKNSFGVKYHLKEIVQRYIEDNWKWSDRATDNLKLGSFTSDKGQNKQFQEWQKQRGKQPKKPIQQPPPTTTGVDEKLLGDLEAMGFKNSEASKALQKFANNFDKALDHLFSLGPSAREPEKEPGQVTPDKELVHQMTAMGFDKDKAEAVLMLTNNNMEDAIEFLFNNPDFNVPKGGGKGGSKGGGLLSSITSWFKGDPDEALARQLEEEERSLNKLSKSTESTLAITDTNFFVGMIAYLRARLANFTRYCMVCHKKHSCISEKPVICCNPLCIFRYSDLLPSSKKEIIKETMDKVAICPFTDCEEVARLNKEEAIDAAFYGACTSTQGTTQEALLEMHRHRYLPNDQVLEFIENGVKRNNMQIAKVDNVLKAELVVDFEAAWEELKKKRGPDSARPQIAFHGTSDNNINSILERGLLVPGQGKGADIKHATDTGWWGKGIYLSPNSQLSVGYCRGGKKLLICAALMGKTFKCSNRLDGQPCQPGYDSHEDPSGQEWILFNPAQVLPCYLITFA